MEAFFWLDFLVFNLKVSWKTWKNNLVIPQKGKKTAVIGMGPGCLRDYLIRRDISSEW